jgi:hypothetical protein
MLLTPHRQYAYNARMVELLAIAASGAFECPDVRCAHCSGSGRPDKSCTVPPAQLLIGKPGVTYENQQLKLLTSLAGHFCITAHTSLSYRC